MSQIKPSTHGIVVEHKESGVRYAVPDENYNSDIHRKIRDLKPHESVLSYQPKQGSEPVEQTDEEPADIDESPDSAEYQL